MSQYVVFLFLLSLLWGCDHCAQPCGPDLQGVGCKACETGACVDPSSSEGKAISEKVSAAANFNQQSFESALKGKGLSLTTTSFIGDERSFCLLLDVNSKGTLPCPETTPPIGNSMVEGTVYSFTATKGETITFLAGPFVGYCGGNNFEVVKDASGGIYRLIRKTHATVVENYAFCGCGGGLGICATPTMYQPQPSGRSLVVLPSAAAYKGNFTLEYDVQSIGVSWVNNTGKQCPPVPMGTDFAE